MSNFPANQQQKQLTPIDRVKNVLNMDTVKEQFKNALAENSNSFCASIIELVASDTNLQQCDPKLIVMEALKAATLKLPINKALGFAYVVPYKKKGGAQVPTFQIGYKGLVQLAMRTGQYRRLNDGFVFEGQFKGINPLTGELDITGTPKSDKVIGYFAYFELLNGFSKVMYMTTEEVARHGERYSKSFSYDSSPWKTNFDAMAIKTCWRRLLSKYGIMSVEMESALSSEEEQHLSPVAQLEQDHAAEANRDVIDIDVDHATGEVINPETINQAGPPPQQRPSDAPSWA
jgi:recombination protein RecT